MKVVISNGLHLPECRLSKLSLQLCYWYVIDMEFISHVFESGEEISIHCTKRDSCLHSFF